MMRWQVVEVSRSGRETNVGRPLPVGKATALRGLLCALQTDGSRIDFIIRQTTGFERE